ncbi:DUF2092 domain-containing protein [Roseococcus sp. SDR]|uniref:DUF2092 domain-containing protein n=1 Tax=Roseococcus sp. SDR TaxID=2835532 RepID=UPI001BCBB683|nr:DUF2092 domain-containing protein [Roseococcus sp. SDR]MBS7793167.1 DUF2092 domain-containing protein [Roseococcus sp. SDR]MBV1848481.1 DUF2092 domain-containing protein [Roseococcus sp. SDR]
MPRSPVPFWRGLAGGALALLAACAEPAQAPVTAPPPAVLDAEVSDALRRMATTLTSAPAFTLNFTTLREAPAGPGTSILLSGQGAVVAARPDRLYAAVGSDVGSYSLWYDGRAFTALNTFQNIYATTPLTGDIETALKGVESRLGVTLPILPLLANDPYAMLTPAGTTGRHIGRSIIRDVLVDHYALNGPTGHWEIWLEAAPSALPLRVSFVEPGPERLRTILEFQSWNLRPRLPAGTFAFTPPRDAARADFLPRGEALTRSNAR